MLKGFFDDRKFFIRSLISAVIVLVFLVLWLYKLGEWPGLHGDEASFGVGAYGYKSQGIRSLSGMTFYTGILQNLAALISFKIFGVGVWQLRIAGIIFNALAVFFTASWFLKVQSRKMLFIFLLFLLQSSITLIYPRIAWEVNTFNHLFLTLILIFLFEMQKATGRWQIFLFLLLNLACTYNHFIGSAIGISLFLGFTATFLINKESRYLDLIGVLSLNAINLCVYMCAWFLTQGFFWGQILVLLFLTIVLVLETLFIEKWQRLMVSVLYFFSNVNIPHRAYRLLLTIVVVGFLWFHGWGLWAVLSNKALIETIFSFQYPVVVQFVLKTIGMIFLVAFIWYLLYDIWQTNAGLYAICIIAYLGVLTVLTRQNATRYYVITIDLVCLFLSLRIVQNLRSKFSLMLLSAACISLVITLGGLLYLQSHPERKVRVFYTEITPGLAEPTGRFFPMEPLLSDLKKRGVSKITSAEQVHNIALPISFYLLVEDFRKADGPVAIVEYDEQNFGDGFRIKYISPGTSSNQDTK
jgi:hypothetical protein